MLNAQLRPLLRAHEPRSRVCAHTLGEQSNGSKRHILSMFSKTLINFARCITRSRHVACGTRRTCSGRRNMWCRSPRNRARSCKNTGFFAAL